MNKQFDGLFGNKVLAYVTASTTLLRKSLWLMLFSLGWASSAQAAIPATERQVLLDLYASTNGAGWINNAGWNGVAGTECTWFGIFCNGDHAHWIELNSNNLVGNLPSLSGLTGLTSINVGRNQLTGSIPSLNGLTSLQQFIAFREAAITNVPV